VLQILESLIKIAYYFSNVFPLRYAECRYPDEEKIYEINLIWCIGIPLIKDSQICPEFGLSAHCQNVT